MASAAVTRSHSEPWGPESQTLSFGDVRGRSPELGARPAPPPPHPAAADATVRTWQGGLGVPAATTARCPQCSLSGSHAAVRLQPSPSSPLPSLRHPRPAPTTPRPRLCMAGRDPSGGPPRGDPKGPQGGARRQVQHPGPGSRSIEGVCAALLGRQALFLRLVPPPRPPARPGSGEPSVGKDELWA